MKSPSNNLPSKRPAAQFTYVEAPEVPPSRFASLFHQTLWMQDRLQVRIYCAIAFALGFTGVLLAILGIVFYFILSPKDAAPFGFSCFGVGLLMVLIGILMARRPPDITGSLFKVLFVRLPAALVLVFAVADLIMGAMLLVAPGTFTKDFGAFEDQTRRMGFGAICIGIVALGFAFRLWRSTPEQKQNESA